MENPDVTTNELMEVFIFTILSNIKQS